nr:hypothetical protein [Enterococcus sp. DIV0849a]
SAIAVLAVAAHYGAKGFTGKGAKPSKNPVLKGSKDGKNQGKSKGSSGDKKASGAKLTVETTTNSKIPTIHKPNTVIKRVDKNGNLISERIFDDKGRVIKDIHHTDHGNPKMHPKVPHEHIWDWSDPKKPRPSK